MTDPSTPTAPVGTLLRISVTAGDRRVDLGAPGNVAVVEIVPGLARALGMLDAASVYGGYRLVTAEGSTLDPARTKGEHALLAAYRRLNAKQQGALLEVARSMQPKAARK